MKHIALAVSASLICSACASSRPSPSFSDAPAFSAKEAAFIHKRGRVYMTGEAFIIGASGKPIYAAGETIRLVPATRYAQARFNKLYQGKTYIPAARIPRVTPDPQYSKYTKTTVSSARGKFAFDNLGPGDYFVTAQKIIATPGKFQVIGGAMYTRVTIRGDERYPVKIVITDR